MRLSSATVSVAVLLQFALVSAARALDFSGQIANFTGKGYELGSKRSKLLFTLERVYSADARSAETRYFDLSGKPLVTEKMQIDARGDLLAYEVLQHQTGEQGRIELKGSKLIFTRGSSVSEEEVVPNWVSGPSVIPYLSRNWSRILEGKSVKVRLALWDRQETVGFDLFKERIEKGPDGKDRVIIKMKPSSFIISALVTPLYFTMGMDGKSIDSMQGRVLPKIQDGSKWKDLDADVVY